MTALSLRGVHKSYGGVHVLRGIDLDLEAGSTTAILGPSGCGKTTLLRMIAGFDRPDAGIITLGGKQVSAGRRSLPPDKRDIGYVAQEGALFPHLSVEANLTFGLPRLSTSRARRRARAAELLELVSLDVSLARRHPHQLSGGQQQRVALARALARRPALVLLDEPFSSLDTALREATRAAVAAALKAENVTTLMVTHDQAEALSMADQIAVMADGSFAQTGTPQRLYAEPGSERTALILGPATILEGKADRGQAVCALGRLPVSPPCRDGDATILIRPESLHLSENLGQVTATVVASEFFGADSVVTARLADGSLIRARTAGAAAFHSGQSVAVSVRGPVHAYPRASL